MLTVEEIKKSLEIMNIQAVAKKTNLKAQTIYRLLNGNNPSYMTVKVLSDYLEGF